MRIADSNWQASHGDIDHPPVNFDLPSVQVSGERYLWAVLAMLFMVNLLNYMDRFIMAILAEPVRREFGLSDTQVGLLTGLGFALVYSLLLVPVARLSDRFNRKIILTMAVVGWSLMTALCGIASSYATLLIARAGVGVGEAAGLPAMHSMTSDFFVSRRRAMALSIVGLGGAVGGTLGFLVGGLVSQHSGWRNAFLVSAAPGLLVALIIGLGLREPIRGLSDGAISSLPSAPVPPRALMSSLRELCARKSYAHIIAAVTFASLSMMGMGAWNGVFFIRVVGLRADQAGALLMVANVIGTFLGTLLGGWFCKRFYDVSGRILVRTMTFSFAVMPPLALAMLLSPSTGLAIALLPLVCFASAFWLGPFYAAMQELAAPRDRATSAGFGLLFFNLFGAGCGPLAIGLLSDWLAKHRFATPLRWAMAFNLIFCLLGLVHIRLANRTIATDLAAIASDTSVRSSLDQPQAILTA